MTARYVHLVMDRIESKATDNADEFKRICKEWQPDIIHQYGNIDVKHQDDYRWVISPNGQPVPSFDTYYAVIARSPIEAENLSQNGVKRIETIKNPLITKQVDFDETVQKTMHVYQKVMNSDPLSLMDENTKKAIPVIFKAAICGDKRWVDSNLPVPSVQMRLLYIYASLEGMLPLLFDGLKILGIEQPAREVFECYLPEKYAIPSAMTGSNIANMLADIQDNGVSIRRLADIYSALLIDSHDDEKLNAVLEEKELKPLFQSILRLLQEFFYIDDGYLPSPPIDNSETQHLRMNLQNHLRL